MVSTCPGPRVEVTGPRIRPARFGLFSVAEVETVEDGTWEWGLQYRSQGCDANVYSWPRPCIAPPLPVQPVTIRVELFVGAAAPDDGTPRLECSPPEEHRDYRTLFAVASADPCWALPPSTRIQVQADGGHLVTIPILGPKGAAEEEADGAGNWVAAIPKDCVSRILIREAGLGAEKYVDFRPDLTGAAVTFDLSPDPEAWLNERRKVLDGPPGYVCGDPFWIYTSAACMPGADFTKDAEPMARRRMETGEQRAVEEWLWRSMRESHPIPVGGECSGSFRRMPWPAARLEVCLSRLETALTQTLGGMGVLHVPSVVAMRLASLGSIWTDLSGWYTPLGTPVVFGTGYDATLGPVDQGVTPDQIVMYGTGPVTVRRGPVNVYDGFDRLTNNYAAIAERAYALTTDCALLYTACPNDWCQAPEPDEDEGEDEPGQPEPGP
ncbi:hypothetical protein Strvi_0034 (plasmid) [Streptomyces violaceusniger Tu 4113]|uniref:Uncharacterized protein n=1 Tax=Streptomyces violaceusniger (strain Tu 4113) TaxID=653045 RepID=G2PHG5_STRV4|nr:hypothetical protein Strvi_0034 [Streptomyces violaceusniger Tu 4113]